MATVSDNDDVTSIEIYAIVSVLTCFSKRIEKITLHKK